MGKRTRTVLALAGGVLLVTSVVQVVRSQCRWGTFAYQVGVEDPTSQEDWRADAAVLVEGHETVVTKHHKVIYVALSPDGEQVVVAKGEGPTDDEYVGVEPTGLFTYDVDGSSERRLTTSGSQPDWSPDGETIVFFSEDTIRTVDVDDREEREVYRMPPPRGVDPDYFVDATWSSDSSRIAFAIGRRHGPGASVLWTMRADGSDLRRVAVVGDSTDDLAWSPDGETFAWSGMYEGVFSVVTMPVDGGPIRQVEPNSRTPVWSADGSRLAYVIGHEGRYAPRIVVGDAEGAGEVAVPVAGDARGATSLDDWASC